MSNARCCFFDRKLVQRLDNMKKNALGNGTNRCVLCGDAFGFLGPTALYCKDCKKAACQKCGVEMGSVSTLRAATGSTNWLCKICAETREMWKKSGAWFIKVCKCTQPPLSLLIKA